SEYRREAMLLCSLDEKLSMPVTKRAWLNDQRHHTSRLHCSHDIVRFEDVIDDLRSQFDTRRMGCLLGSLEPIIGVWPSRIPKIANHRLWLTQLFGELHKFTA